MKSFYPTMIIISAEVSTLSEKENIQCTAELTSLLNDMQIPFTPLIGRFSGVDEASFGIPLPADRYQALQRYEVLLRLARDFAQVAVLYLHPDRAVDQIDVQSGKAIHLGQWTAISETEAKTLNAYTFDPKTGVYYVAR